jgi:hypothetical protein
MSITEGATTVQDSLGKPVHDDTAVAPHPDDHLASSIGKLSANVDADLFERLRELAHVHRVSESSIVDVALRRFFALGDDAALGAILHKSGATLRRKQSSKHVS